MTPFVTLEVYTPHQRWPRLRKKELKRSYLALLVAMVSEKRGTSRRAEYKRGSKLLKRIRFSRRGARVNRNG